MLELAKFPLEILAEIAALCSGCNVFKLTYICGDLVLQSKLFRSVKVLYLKEYWILRKSLLFTRDFQKLLEVYIRSHSDGGWSLYDLPPQLTTLHVYCSTSTWLKTKPLPSVVEMPGALLLHSGRSSPFNFKSHFPNLRHLTLHGITASVSVILNRILYRFLPSTLESFSTSDPCDPVYWKYLPAGIEMATSVTLNEYDAERLIEFAPHIRFDNIIASELSPVFGRVNARTVTLIAGIVQRTSLEPFLAAFPQHGLPPPRGSPSSRPYLVSLTVSNWRNIFGTAPNWQWPESIQTVNYRDTYYGSPEAVPAKCLPPNLTSLAEQFGTKGTQNWASTLTSLQLIITGTAWILDLDALPKSLVHLHIETKGLWNDAFTPKLPRGLQTLRLQVQWYGNELSRDFMLNLPPTLTHLHTETMCEDSMIKLLPKTITKFMINRLLLTGCIPLVDPICFDQSSQFLFDFYGDGKFELKPTSRYDGFSTIPCSLPLPATLTSINLVKLATDETRPPSILPCTLPNLTRLQVYDYSTLPLKPEDMPSLTFLSVYSFTKVTGVLLPPSLTHFVHRVRWSLELPDSLFTLPKLRIFEASYRPNPSILAKLAHMDEFIIDDVNTWPSDTTFEATSLHFINSPTLPTNFASLFPKLQKLDLHKAALDEEVLPSSLTFVDCGKLTVTSNQRCIPLPSTTTNGTLVLADAISDKIVESMPYKLKLFDKVQFDVFEFELAHWREFGESLRSNTLTKLVIGRNLTVHPRIGQFLPSSLTSLDLLTALGVGSATPQFLPRSITKLKISATSFPSYSFAALPRGLIKLHIECPRFVTRYADALPPSLTTLKIVKMTQLGEKVLLRLPSSITKFSVDLWYSIDHCLQHGVTPKLRYLSAVLSYRETILNLQQTIPTLRELGKMPSLAHNDFLEQLEKVDF